MQTTVRLPDHIWEAAKFEAARSRVTFSELIRQMLTERLHTTEGSCPSIGPPPVVMEGSGETRELEHSYLSAVSDIPVGSHGKGKAELPKILPRKQ